LQQIRGESTGTGTGSRTCVSWRFIDIWQHDDRERGVPNPVSSFYVRLRDHFFTFPIGHEAALIIGEVSQQAARYWAPTSRKVNQQYV
jgi:hypothetical protein